MSEQEHSLDYQPVINSKFDVYCVNCGKRVIFYNLTHRNNYYETLNCIECLKTPVTSSDKEVFIDVKIVYKRWLTKLSLVSHFDNICGSLFHPLTGEKIEDIKQYLIDTGFLIGDVL